MTPIQLSSKSLAELLKIIQKAQKQKDDKLADLAKAAFEDIKKRMEQSKQGPSDSPA